MSIQVPARVEVMHWRRRFPLWCPLRLVTLCPAPLWSWKTPVILIITLLYLHVHGTTDYYSVNCALIQFQKICMKFTRHSPQKNFLWRQFILILPVPKIKTRISSVETFISHCFACNWYRQCHTFKNSAIRKAKAGCIAPTITEQILPTVMYSHSGEFIFMILLRGARGMSASASSWGEKNMSKRVHGQQREREWEGKEREEDRGRERKRRYRGKEGGREREKESEFQWPNLTYFVSFCFAVNDIITMAAHGRHLPSNGRGMMTFDLMHEGSIFIRLFILKQFMFQLFSHY